MAITGTILSRSPARSAFDVALAGVLLLGLSSALFWYGPIGVSEAMDGRAQAIFSRGELWRLWTAIGAHADLRHLLSNLPLFAVFAFLLHGYFGAWGFPILPIALGGAVNALTLLAYPPDASLVGASGVVYLMAGLWLGLFLLIERGQSLAFRLAAIAGFTLILLMPETFAPKTSYLAHAIGFALGLAASPALFRFQRSRIRAAETHFIPTPIPEALEHESLPGAEPYYWLPPAARPVPPPCSHEAHCG